LKSWHSHNSKRAIYINRRPHRSKFTGVVSISGLNEIGFKFTYLFPLLYFWRFFSKSTCAKTSKDSKMAAANTRISLRSTQSHLLWRQSSKASSLLMV